MTELARKSAIDVRTAPYAALVLRLALGIVFVAHGVMKVFVLTLPGTAAFFAAHGFPGWTAYPVTTAEIVGGVLLVAGIATRAVSIALVPVMAGAILVHGPNGWSFTAPGGGWEYVAFLIAALVGQALLGAGAFAWTRASSPGHGAARAAASLAALLTLASPLPADAQSVAQRNAAIGQRYFEEVWNQGRVDVLDELLAPTYVNHTPSTPDPPPGPDGLKPIVLAMRRAFPDLHYEIQDVVATNDTVVLRVVMTGTHRADLFGLPATGRRVSVAQINIEHIRDGRIAEHWRVTDELTLMKQLGVVR